MKIEVHLLTYNEQRMLPFTLLHYKQFATRIIVHDGGSDDRTLEIARDAGCEIRKSSCSGELNDADHAQIKSTAWVGTDADWVIVADTDELIYFPILTPAQTLGMMARGKTWIAKPQGWELFSREFPQFDGKTQIYDIVSYGTKDSKWYSKPILFSPHGVEALQFHVGAHSLQWVRYRDPELRNRTEAGPDFYTRPAIHLFHCKHLGPIEDISARYALNQRRLAPINRERKWGTVEDPLTHAHEKRQMILRNLEPLPISRLDVLR